MSVKKISKIERISILARFVKKCCGETKEIEMIRLAEDLANVIDTLKESNVALSKLSDEFLNFFPEHWKKRTQFLLIVTKYWPEILKEMELDDVLKGRGVVKLTSIPHRAPLNPSEISIIENEDIYTEISEIVEIIKANHSEKISIISPNKDFSRYLLMRLDQENISYNSLVGNSVQSDKFVNEIREKFKDCSEGEIRQIANELSEFDDIPKKESDILIANIPDIPMIQDGIIIYSELNESEWRIHEPGAFWLHYSLRKNLGIAHDQKITENLFYLGIERNKQTFLMRSLKSDGQSNKKSSILAKLEAMAKKSKIRLKSVAPQKSNDTSQFNQSNFLIKSNNFKLPPEVSAQSIELLMKDPYAFYAKEILNLKPIDSDDKQRDTIIAFRNITKSFFESKPIAPWLEVIKKSDFFAYYKALSLIDFLKKLNNENALAHNNLRGQFDFKHFNTTIYGYADRIVENLDSSTLISFQFSSNQSTKEIIYGNSSSLLTLCLIAEKNGFEKLQKPIRKIQIWNLFAIEKNQIISKEIEISKDTIDEFEERLISSFETYFKNDGKINCQPDPKQLYNKYKHFERL